MLRSAAAVACALALLSCVRPPDSAIPVSAIPVKVVVVAMFEGELQNWLAHEKLDRAFPFPQGFHELRMNEDGVLATLTGVGTSRAAASIMALGLDPRFDLRKAYWLVAGIAGVDPADASLGSAAWAEWVVDGDLAHEIDAREIPKEWKTGFVPLRKSVPYEQPRADVGGLFHLDPDLVDWAYRLTRNMTLTDDDAMRQERSQFAEANARRPPFVLKGDTLASSTFWQGKLLDQWANDWVRYHTAGKGNYVTTEMEDSGTLQSLAFLANAARVDLNRVLVLRTASDFDQPAPGETAAHSLARNKIGNYSGYRPALDSAWRVGRVVMAELVKNWDKYRDTMPK